MSRGRSGEGDLENGKRGKGAEKMSAMLPPFA